MTGASTEMPSTEIALQISAEVQFFEPPQRAAGEIGGLWHLCVGPMSVKVQAGRYEERNLNIILI